MKKRKKTVIVIINIPKHKTFKKTVLTGIFRGNYFIKCKFENIYLYTIMVTCSKTW